MITTERLKKYVGRRKEDLQKCSDALRSGDYETLRNISHQIKGNARTFGFIELERIAIELEKVALKNERSATEEQLGFFAGWINTNVL